MDTNVLINLTWEFIDTHAAVLSKKDYINYLFSLAETASNLAQTLEMEINEDQY
jgi:hypothetical protein